MNKKIHSFFLIVLGLLVADFSFAQINTPRPSPGATITQTVGLTDISVTYSRPGMKGRKIFGDLVPYGEVWRTGANKATAISFKDPINLGGKDIPAGDYSLFTIPGPSVWTIIVNKNTELWGSGDYKQEEDIARFTVAAMNLSDAVESFTIDFGHFTDNSAHMILSWENTSVHVPVMVKVKEKVLAQIKATLIDSDKEADAGSYHNAATFYLENDQDLAMALKWEDKAIKMRPEAFWYMHGKARIQAKMGKKEDAIKTAEKSIEVAKKADGGDFGYIKRNQDLIAELK